MLQALELDKEQTVLEIGTGSGFVTACLATLAKSVVSVDIYDELLEEAETKLKDKDLNNAELFPGDVMQGWQPEQAHDVVVVTGSVPEVPEQFLGWVNPGGRGNLSLWSAGILKWRQNEEWLKQGFVTTRYLDSTFLKKS